MTWIRPPVLLGLVLALAGAPAKSHAAEVGDEVLDALECKERVRVVIALRGPDEPELTRAQRLASVEQMQARVLARVPAGSFRPTRRFRAVHGMIGEVDGAGLEALRADPEVRRVDVPRPAVPHLSGSVPLIGADRAHEIGITGEGVLVAVLDTGINADHPDLADDLVLEQCFCVNYQGVNCCPNEEPEQSGPGAAGGNIAHGTHVAGIITAGGVISAPGVAPDAGIVAVKVLDDAIHPVESGPIIQALEWILFEQPDVRIVNMSLGTFDTFPAPCDDDSATTLLYADVVAQLWDDDRIVFTSSGNAADPVGMGIPACVEGFVSVGGTYKSAATYWGWEPCDDYGVQPDDIMCISNSAPSLDLLAPGHPINSTYADKTATLGGTSMASPHAAGIAALLLQLEPDLTAVEILQILKDTGVPVHDGRNGKTFPRIDAAAALGSLLDEVCDDGLDDDLDGFADCADPDCDGLTDGDGVSCEADAELSCDDAGDNDGDGAVDCDDEDCAGTPECDPGGGCGGCATDTAGGPAALALMGLLGLLGTLRTSRSRRAATLLPRRIRMRQWKGIWALWIGTACLLLAGCPGDEDDDAGDDDGGDDDAGDDDTGDDDVADDDGGDDDTSVETVSAYVISGQITWALDFDAAAEGAGHTDCEYTRTYEGVQFLDQPYLCPMCSIQLQGEAVMTDGFSTCYEPTFGGTAKRPEWWSLAWSEVDGEGASFYRSAAENLFVSTELTTVDAITLDTPFDLAWDAEYALSDLGLPDPGNMALSATSSALLSVDPGTQLANPWALRTQPYDCGWPLGNPGTLHTDFVLAADAVFPIAWLEDSCGELVDLWDFHGTYLVFDSTQPDCGPCLQMAEGAADFLATMDTLGIPTVFVSLVGEGLSNVIGEPSQSAFDSYVSNYGVAGEPILKDRGFGYAIFAPYHGDDLGYPTWAVVRPDMTVLEVGVGFNSWDNIRDIIEADAL